MSEEKNIYDALENLAPLAFVFAGRKMGKLADEEEWEKLREELEKLQDMVDNIEDLSGAEDARGGDE